ncbi:metal-dependent hydrolase family protein [Arthrobacter sp. B2a2-09]|uniref:metal-dependent hydrolase family protein n=1 Tax=Arthrobacter sp. B2a2-09 TaxID=2952822 RepID=UPI0022CD2EE4|nr:amidohydrolase family protein [Arthrobacter sp. B2a2-09]MCZ9880266.1 amidohydrolase family protein [Arthrobacter sp. B2a2-09]
MDTTHEQPLTLVNALIFDGSSPDLTEGSIVFRGGRVAEMGDVAEQGQVVDAGGRVVVPGLIDAHFHAYAVGLGGFEVERCPLSYAALVGAKRLGAALRRGFTTVRDVAGGDIGLARAIDAGLFAAPRYFFTGPAFSQTGGHGDPRSADVDICFSHGHMCAVVDGTDNLRRAVRERFRTGSHAIKIMASGGVVSLTDPIRLPQYSAEEIRAVVDEATRRGSYVAAHAYSPEAIVHSVENGVRSIEHGNLLDRPTAALMAERGAFLVPTLAAYDAMDRRGEDLGLNPISQAKNAEVLSAGKEAIVLALQAGVNVGFGSDLMGDLEDDQLAGVRLQIEAAGVLETLRSMTAVNSELLQNPDIGRLGTGSVGDAVLLDGNPFEDPSVLWDEARPRTVIQHGRTVA